MPADQLDRTMDVMSASLGVRCNFCHVQGAFEKDGKREKQTAREMINMTLAINKNNFENRQEVSCNTCHQGRTRPASLVAVGQSAPMVRSGADGAANATANPNAARPKETLPTVDEVIAKYVQALGGKDALEKVTSREIVAARTSPNGSSISEEILWKAPDRMLDVLKTQQGAFETGYNGGANGWTHSARGAGVLSGDDLEQFKREGQLFQPSKLKEIYTQISVVGTEKIGDREAFVVRATTAAKGRERLYFDKQTGLLLRRYTIIPTIIGAYPVQVNYDDYREVGGVKIPFVVRTSLPGRAWERKVAEVKLNPAIDDARFNPPAATK